MLQRPAKLFCAGAKARKATSAGFLLARRCVKHPYRTFLRTDLGCSDWGGLVAADSFFDLTRMPRRALVRLGVVSANGERPTKGRNRGGGAKGSPSHSRALDARAVAPSPDSNRPCQQCRVAREVCAAVSGRGSPKLQWFCNRIAFIRAPHPCCVENAERAAPPSPHFDKQVARALRTRDHSSDEGVGARARFA